MANETAEQLRRIVQDRFIANSIDEAQNIANELNYTVSVRRSPEGEPFKMCFARATDAGIEAAMVLGYNVEVARIEPRSKDLILDAIIEGILSEACMCPRCTARREALKEPAVAKPTEIDLRTQITRAQLAELLAGIDKGYVKVTSVELDKDEPRPERPDIQMARLRLEYEVDFRAMVRGMN